MKHLKLMPWRLAIVPTFAVVALAACSSGPPPNAALAASAASLESARSSGAPEFASAELNDARTKLERARALAQAGKNREAIRMAEQADADAQYARAKAGSERSRRAADEVAASLSDLRDELNRMPPTGAGPASGTPPMPSADPQPLRTPQ